MKNKTIYAILSVLFALFAILQYNDPDPWTWILIYGSVALIALFKMYLPQVNFKPLIITLIIIFILYAATFLPYVIEFFQKPNKSELVGAMKVNKPWIEGTREFGGLILGIGALFYLLRSKLK